jgi:hypothetical protein
MIGLNQKSIKAQPASNGLLLKDKIIDIIPKELNRNKYAT